MARPYLPSFFGRSDDPFGSLFREVQKTFEDFSQRTPFARFSSDMLSPKIDVAESKDAIEVTAEFPGVDEKDLDVTLANGMLTVRGEKRTERDEQDKDKNWHVVERAMARSAERSPCRSILTPRRSRRSLIRAYCTSTCQSQRRWRRSSKRSRSKKASTTDARSVQSCTIVLCERPRRPSDRRAP